MSRPTQFAESPARVRKVLGRRKRPIVRTAFHEAGHAVAAIHFGCPFSFVHIRPNADHLGALNIGLDGVAWAREFPCLSAVVDMAGAIAEGGLCRHRPWFLSTTDARSVYRTADHFLGRYLAEEWIQEAWLETCRTLTRRGKWAAIEAIAGKMLAGSGQLFEPDVRAAYERAVHGYNPAADRRGEVAWMWLRDQYHPFGAIRVWDRRAQTSTTAGESQ